MQTVLITGVSSGIGYGAVEALIGAGYRVIGTVRKQQDADTLQKKWGEHYHPLLLDVTSASDIEQLPAAVSRITGGKGLFCLINNSGIAKSAPVQVQPMSDIREHFEVNFFGLVAVTKALLPLLGATPDSPYPPGRILNISSVGGKIAAPFIAAYVASKHAVEGFSESLRRELMIFGVKVIIVGPGSIRTSIWSKAAGTGDLSYLDGTGYGAAMRRFAAFAHEAEQQGYTPEQIGAYLLGIVRASKPKVRYAYVPGKFLNWTLPNLLPASWVDALLSQRLELKKRTP